MPALAAGLVLVLAAMMLAGSAQAGSHNWDGGHDISGWTAPAREFYFAEGNTLNGFEEYLLLRNPLDKDAEVTVNYLFPAEPPQVQQLSLPAWSGASIRVNDSVAAGKDVSMAITSSSGIVAERQMYFNYKGVWTGGHATRGVGQPSARWYFAEGTTRDRFVEWLCLQNPQESEVTANVTYYLGTGENRNEQVVLPANSRRTIHVNAAVGPEQDVSIEVDATQPVVAERPMYFDYKSAWRGGHTACGSEVLGREWYFAEGTTRSGFEEYLCMLNPGPETTVAVEYMFAGQPSSVCYYTLRARARSTLFVNEVVGPEKDVSIRVTCPQDILCERPMYFCYGGLLEGGHDAMGTEGGDTTWYFPSSGAGAGFSSWLCVMNPNEADNHVKVDVIGDGGRHTDEIDIPALSRYTVDLSAASEGLGYPWVKVTADAPVMVERPVYFSYEPKVEPAPFAFATWDGIELKSPIRYCDLLGPVFHEASSGNGCPPMQPLGSCLRDDNPARMAPGITRDAGGETAYFIEESRGRGTYSTTACDVQAKAGTVVYAPVTGLVVTAESYLLYGQYPDLRVRIAIDGRPGYQAAILHMSQLLVAQGQWAEAGKTPIGIVRDLVPYFNSGPNAYTRDDGNHCHVQINYAGAGAGATEAP